MERLLNLIYQIEKEKEGEKKDLFLRFLKSPRKWQKFMKPLETLWR